MKEQLPQSVVDILSMGGDVKALKDRLWDHCKALSARTIVSRGGIGGEGEMLHMGSAGGMPGDSAPGSFVVLSSEHPASGGAPGPVRSFK